MKIAVENVDDLRGVPWRSVLWACAVAVSGAIREHADAVRDVAAALRERP